MKQFVKFLSLGFFTYGLSMGLTYLGVDILGYSQKIVYACVLVVIAILNFFSATQLIFQSKNSLKIFFRYVFFLLLFTLGNYYFTQLAIYNFGEKYLYVIIFFITTAIFGIKFFAYKKFVFQK